MPRFIATTYALSSEGTSSNASAGSAYTPSASPILNKQTRNSVPNDYGFSNFFDYKAAAESTLKQVDIPQKNYSNLSIIEIATTQGAYPIDVRQHTLLDFSYSNSIFGGMTGVLAIKPTGDSPSLNTSIFTKIGDIIEVTYEDTNSGGTLFVGVVDSIASDKNGRDNKVVISLSGFLESTKTRSWQATAFVNGLPVKDQTALNRSTEEVLKTIAAGNYLPYGKMYSDIADTTFFSIFSINDTQYDILTKVADTYLRLVFQRRDGTTFITQLYNEVLSEKLNRWDINDLQDVIFDIERVTDYSDVPYTGILSYGNSPILAANLISGRYELLQAPNKNTVRNNIAGSLMQFPNTANLSITVGIRQQNPELGSEVVSVELDAPDPVVPEGLVAQKVRETQETFKQLATFQLLQTAYQGLPTTDRITFSLPYVESYNTMDVGDIFNLAITNEEDAGNYYSIPGLPTSALSFPTLSGGIIDRKFYDFWIVADISINLSSAQIDVTLIPLNHTTPSLTLRSPSTQLWRGQLPEDYFR